MEGDRLRTRDAVVMITIIFILGFIAGAIIGYAYAYEECLTMGARLALRYTNVGQIINISEEGLTNLLKAYGGKYGA